MKSRRVNIFQTPKAALAEGRLGSPVQAANREELLRRTEALGGASAPPTKCVACRVRRTSAQLLPNAPQQRPQRITNPHRIPCCQLVKCPLIWLASPLGALSLDSPAGSAACGSTRGRTAMSADAVLAAALRSRKSSWASRTSFAALGMLVICWQDGAHAQDVKIAKTDTQIDALDPGIKLSCARRWPRATRRSPTTTSCCSCMARPPRRPATSTSPTRTIPGPTGW